jgi:hypothetical protein
MKRLALLSSTVHSLATNRDYAKRELKIDFTNFDIASNWETLLLVFVILLVAAVVLLFIRRIFFAVRNPGGTVAGPVVSRTKKELGFDVPNVPKYSNLSSSNSSSSGNRQRALTKSKFYKDLQTRAAINPLGAKTESLQIQQLPRLYDRKPSLAKSEEPIIRDNNQVRRINATLANRRHIDSYFASMEHAFDGESENSDPPTTPYGRLFTNTNRNLRD